MSKDGIYKLIFYTFMLSLVSIFTIYTVINANTSDEEVSAYTYWQNRIQKVGPAEAHEELATKVDALGADEQHLEAHYFGGALYRETGAEGIAVCDSRFLYGCLHEFVGSALTLNGASYAPILSELCVSEYGLENATTCHHGLGHGLLSYFGYNEDSFFDALAVCEDLKDNDVLYGCRGGIFMEFNLRTMLGEEQEVRKSEDLFYPCSLLSKDNELACNLWQPQWWRNYPFFIGPNGYESEEEIYQEMGEACRNLSSEPKLNELCYRGIGENLIFVINFDVPNIITLCNSISSREEDQATCIIASAMRAVNWQGLDGVGELCEALKGEYNDKCHRDINDEYERRKYFMRPH